MIMDDLKMLWSYLSAIQVYDIETNQGVERFRNARSYYNDAYSKAESLQSQLSDALLKIAELQAVIEKNNFDLVEAEDVAEVAG